MHWPPKRGPALIDESTTAGNVVEGEMKIYNLLAKYNNTSVIYQYHGAPLFCHTSSEQGRAPWCEIEPEQSPLLSQIDAFQIAV